MVINRDKFNFLTPVELADEQWQKLIALGSPKTVKAGTLLHEQSMTVSELTCVTEGSVTIVHFFDNGNEKLCESLTAPSVLGIEALWSEDEGFYPSIVAVTDVNLVTIPLDAAEKMISAMPEMMIALFRCVRNSLCISRIRSVCSAPMSVLQKAAFAIVFLREADKDEDGYTRVTHEELAQLIGISRANVTSALAELTQMGLVGKKRGRVKILDNDKLMELLDNPL